MIVFDLACESGHRFEGWFGSSQDFAEQQESGLVACPQCGSHSIAKAPMAPAVPRKGNRRSDPVPVAPNAENGEVNVSPAVVRGPLPPQVVAALTKLAEAQHEALRGSKWVGKKFAETSRAMHYGEHEEEAVHGQASLEEAQALIEEGISIAPLPFPIAPPDEVN